MTCWLTFLDYASSGLAWLLQWEGNYEDNEVIFCHTIVALMKVCATVKFSTLIPNSWQHLGATHFHLIPHSHGNTSGQPTSISSHILMATLWGNPFPSHPTFSWQQHLGATHFHLIPHSHGNILGQSTSISKGKANEVDVVVLWKGLVQPVPPRKHLEPCEARC
jgi:hypothetical protein